MTAFSDEIKHFFSGQDVSYDEPMSEHTSFRTGGPADVFVNIRDTDSLKVIITLAIKEKIPYYIFGNGSNVLVADEGIRGIVIRPLITPELIFDGTRVKASAGCSLAKLSKQCSERGLEGLEFAAGIPGTVGGAVVMNAGAYGGEIKDRLVTAEVMDREGNSKVLDNEELKLGYRTSIIPEADYIVLGAEFELTPGNRDKSFGIIADLAARRRDKQPLEYPSAGSTFKRPEGYFAGKLIEDAGLKGFSVGGACVSTKHAGFVINKDRASSKDIYDLIGEVRKRVFENSGVMLEPEVKLIGF